METGKSISASALYYCTSCIFSFRTFEVDNNEISFSRFIVTLRFVQVYMYSMYRIYYVQYMYRIYFAE